MQPSPKHRTSSSRLGTGPKTVAVDFSRAGSFEAVAEVPSTSFSKVDNVWFRATVTTVDLLVDRGNVYRVLS